MPPRRKEIEPEEEPLRLEDFHRSGINGPLRQEHVLELFNPDHTNVKGNPDVKREHFANSRLVMRTASSEGVSYAAIAEQDSEQEQAKAGDPLQPLQRELQQTPAINMELSHVDREPIAAGDRPLGEDSVLNDQSIIQRGGPRAKVTPIEEEREDDVSDSQPYRRDSRQRTITPDDSPQSSRQGSDAHGLDWDDGGTQAYRSGTSQRSQDPSGEYSRDSAAYDRSRESSYDRSRESSYDRSRESSQRSAASDFGAAQGYSEYGQESDPYRSSSSDAGRSQRMEDAADAAYRRPSGPPQAQAYTPPNYAQSDPSQQRAPAAPFDDNSIMGHFHNTMQMLPPLQSELMIDLTKRSQAKADRIQSEAKESDPASLAQVLVSEQLDSSTVSMEEFNDSLHALDVGEIMSRANKAPKEIAPKAKAPIGTFELFQHTQLSIALLPGDELESAPSKVAYVPPPVAVKPPFQPAPQDPPELQSPYKKPSINAWLEQCRIDLKDDTRGTVASLESERRLLRPSAYQSPPAPPPTVATPLPPTSGSRAPAAHPFSNQASFLEASLDPNTVREQLAKERAAPPVTSDAVLTRALEQDSCVLPAEVVQERIKESTEQIASENNAYVGSFPLLPTAGAQAQQQQQQQSSAQTQQQQQQAHAQVQAQQPQTAYASAFPLPSPQQANPFGSTGQSLVYPASFPHPQVQAPVAHPVTNPYSHGFMSPTAPHAYPPLTQPMSSSAPMPYPVNNNPLHAFANQMDARAFLQHPMGMSYSMQGASLPAMPQPASSSAATSASATEETHGWTKEVDNFYERYKSTFNKSPDLSDEDLAHAYAEKDIKTICEKLGITPNHVNLIRELNINQMRALQATRKLKLAYFKEISDMCQALKEPMTATISAESTIADLTQELHRLRRDVRRKRAYLDEKFFLAETAASWFKLFTYLLPKSGPSLVLRGMPLVETVEDVKQSLEDRIADEYESTKQRPPEPVNSQTIGLMVLSKLGKRYVKSVADSERAQEEADARNKEQEMKDMKAMIAEMKKQQNMMMMSHARRNDVSVQSVLEQQSLQAPRRAPVATPVRQPAARQAVPSKNKAPAAASSSAVPAQAAKPAPAPAAPLPDQYETASESEEEEPAPAPKSPPSILKPTIAQPSADYPSTAVLPQYNKPVQKSVEFGANEVRVFQDDLDDEGPEPEELEPSRSGTAITSQELREKLKNAAGY